MSHKPETVDVREDIRSGREPFSRIMSVVAKLESDQELLLIAPFEPKPLFAVMKKQGFSCTSRPTPTGDWEVRFTRQADAAPSTDNPAQSCSTVSPTGQVIQIDARGLEPPQPMVRILESLAGLQQNAQLDALTDRRPMHLYAQLEDRGFAAETEEQTDGSFLTHIRRA